MYDIDEVGEKIKLHNTTLQEAKQMTTWGVHSDRLYANYDFPKFDNKEIIDWLRRKNTKSKFIMSICDMNDKVIGYISLRKISKIFRTSELGILLDPNKLGNGYGTDAINTLAKWYFEKLKFKRLFLSVAMYNNRAYRVYKKVGFVPKYTLYEEFNNFEIDVFDDERYKYIKKYFKTSFHKIYVKCIKMELSTK